MNSKCGVQIKRRRESHESCVCIVGFPACVCQKKSVVYETECRHAAVQRGKQDQKHLEHCIIVIPRQVGCISFLPRGHLDVLSNSSSLTLSLPQPVKCPVLNLDRRAG